MPWGLIEANFSPAHGECQKVPIGRGDSPRDGGARACPWRSLGAARPFDQPRPAKMTEKSLPVRIGSVTASFGA